MRTEEVERSSAAGLAFWAGGFVGTVGWVIGKSVYQRKATKRAHTRATMYAHDTCAYTTRDDRNRKQNKARGRGAF
jgi:hypothetical protein